MKKELVLYEIFPKVVKTNQSTAITIKSTDYSTAFSPDDEYTVKVLPLCGSLENANQEYFCMKLKPVDNTITFVYQFGAEQEYYVRISKDAKSYTQFSVYAVDQDLYERFPYMGDLHVHTCFSDGRESPEYVASTYRKHGFDFIAITDHRRYEPSMRAIHAYEGVKLDFKLYPGEEVHAPNNHIHIVHFGGDYSVNKLYEDNEAKYYEEVAEIQKTLGDLGDDSAFEYASCLWVYKKIAEAKGLSIFAHPHWLADVYHVRDSMTSTMLANAPFDAFELLGGMSVEENNMQTAFYNQARQNGSHNYGIVGSSDSHGCIQRPYFNQTKTIAFSPSNSRDDIVCAIKNKYSVAVEHITGENYRVYGDYRLVSFALFLLREYFPVHDELCFEEGRAMFDLVKGHPKASQLLSLMYGRTTELLNKWWGR